jgi:hypothetical protein
MDGGGIEETLRRLAGAMKGDVLTQVGGVENPSMQIIGRHGWLEVGYDEIDREWKYYWDGPRTSFDPADEDTPILLGRLLYELDGAHERCGVKHEESAHA